MPKQLQPNQFSWYAILNMTTNYPNDPDGKVLAELEARGVDLTAETLVEFSIDVPDETAARNVVSVIPSTYESEVYYDEGEPDYNEGVDDLEFGPSWTVYAKQRAIPTYDFLVKSQAELNVLVTPYGGKVDGWGIRT